MNRMSAVSAWVIVGLAVVAPALGDWDDGVAAFQAKNFEAAARSFERLVEQNPDGWRGHYMLGLSLIRLQRKDEALHHLRKAYDLNPNDLSVKLELGRAYSLARRYSDCAKMLGAIDLNPLPERARRNGTQVRAVCRDKSGDTHGAYEDYSLVAAMDPDDVRVQYRAGVLAAGQGDTSTARRYLEQADRIVHDDPDLKIEVKKALARVLRRIHLKKVREKSRPNHHSIYQKD